MSCRKIFIPGLFSQSSKKIEKKTPLVAVFDMTQYLKVYDR